MWVRKGGLVAGERVQMKEEGKPLPLAAGKDQDSSV